MNNENTLGSENINKLIIKFAIPSIVSLLVSSAYNITDQIFIGNVVGMLGNAATNVAFPIVTFTTALAQLVGVGTAANFNINMGAKNKKEAKDYLINGLIFVFVLSIFILLFTLIFSRQILIFSGSTNTVLPYALKYLHITAIGLPCLLFSICTANLIRADGSPTYSMLCNVIGAIINVFLDWLFMYPLGLGIEGAAYATITGQILSFFLSLIYFFRFKSVKLNISDFRFRLQCFIGIVKLGMSNLINLVIIMLVNIILNNMLTFYGAKSIYGSDIPLAISGVVSKIVSILTAISVGLAQGCQPILGFNIGAKKYARVKSTFLHAIIISSVFCVIIFIVFQFFPDSILRIFGNGDELYFTFGRLYLRIYMFMVFSYGIQPLAINYFSAIGNVKSGIFLSIAKQGLILIPLLFIFSYIWGINGTLFAGPISDFTATVLSLYLVFLNFRYLGI